MENTETQQEKQVKKPVKKGSKPGVDKSDAIQKKNTGKTKAKNKGRRPLKKTSTENLKLRLIHYTHKLGVNKTRCDTFAKKIANVEHEMSCRKEEEEEENENAGCGDAAEVGNAEESTDGADV
jgi:hypothetical protein